MSSTNELFASLDRDSGLELCSITDFRKQEPISNDIDPVPRPVVSGEPIPVSASITTTYVKDLHELLQSSEYWNYNITPVFDYELVTTEKSHGYQSVLKLECKNTNTLVREFRNEGSAPSKKHAKEEVAGMGYNWIFSKEGKEVIGNLPTRNTDAVALNGKGHQQETLETENWVGMLQGNIHPLPSPPCLNC
jgi:hypothetical protein